MRASRVKVCSEPPALRQGKSGIWRVVSIDLGPQIAHSHPNILKAARAALRDEPGLAAEDITWSRYRKNNHSWPCCLLSRVGLMAVFDHLHNVPRCRNIRAVLDEYHRLFDEKYPRWAEPAPDSAIAPPEPEPAETLEPAPQGDLSRRITEAIVLLGMVGAPAAPVAELRAWDSDRLWQDLTKRAKSWTQVHAIYATAAPMADCH